ncbi:MAG: hypothetical protein M0017_04475 [Desulfobacteraceae bacterium]|nr:hypothetical protein [Desulfobacteraceae bacterium]
MKTKTGKRSWTFGAAALLIFLLVLPSLAKAAAGPVTGRYLRAEGQLIQLQITIGSPTPASIIVVQNLPPGTAIVQARPQVNRYDMQSGEAKWLLRGSGTLLLELDLAQPVRPGQIRGQVRYKDPATGATMTEDLAP